MKRHLTYANVVCTILLILAVGGGGVAVAAALGKNTVGSPQLKPQSVKRADLAKNAVDGSRVRNNRLTGADIEESTLARVRESVRAARAENVLVASISKEGSLIGERSRSVQTASVNFAGVYRVVFDRDVSSCAISASLGAGEAANHGYPTAFIHARVDDPEVVVVEVYAPNFTGYVAAPFTLIAIC